MSAPPNPSQPPNFPFYLVPAPPQAPDFHHHIPQAPPSMFPPPNPISPDLSGDMSKSAAKRPASDSGSARKKVKQDMEDEDGEHELVKEGSQKAKATRGSRACTVCRRLKMKCVGAEQGPPCKRCEAGGHECIFEESNRGKRSTKKSEAMQRSLNKMEKTLDVVLRSLGNPALQNLAETLQRESRSPSPADSSPQLAQHTANLMSPSPSTQQTPETHAHGPPRTDSSMSNHRAASRIPPSSPKLDSLPDSTLNPLGLLADTSLAHRRERDANRTGDDHIRDLLPQGSNWSTEPRTGEKVGLANDRYFKPGPMTILPLRRLYIERQIQPEMLTFVTKEEVMDLFKIYFDHMNPCCCLLDPVMHTPSLVCSRSPFLLTTMCAIAAKFYPARPDLHDRLIKICKKLAFSVPANGFKSVEIVQAYLLTTMWGVGPVERFEQEHTWMLLGLALRMATDINLHRKIPYAPDDSEDARSTNWEIRNRERTWLLCFSLDRSYAAQMGKPHSILEDFTIRNAAQWWQHPQALPLDAGIAAYAEYQRTLSRSLDFLHSGINSTNGIQTDCDYLLVIKTAEAQLSGWIESWSFHATSTPMSERAIHYRGVIAQFYFHYANLVLNSFGLQNALERSSVDIAHFFGRCHSSAVSCARLVKDELGPQGYLQYSPDSTFVFFSYALLTLLKLIRSEFKSFIDNEKAILDLVSDVCDLFERIAVNQHHTPALYAAFLRALVSSKSGATRPGTPVSQQQPNGADGSMPPPEHDHSAPPPDPGHFSKPPSESNGTGMHQHSQGFNPYNAFQQYNGEMGSTQVQDMTTFPPTFAAPETTDYGMFSMDNILGDNFWDSVLIPGYSNSFEGLAGGVVYGAGGSGFISPKRTTPNVSGANSPLRGLNPFGQSHINTAFNGP